MRNLNKYIMENSKGKILRNGLDDEQWKLIIAKETRMRFKKALKKVTKEYRCYINADVELEVDLLDIDES